jgi:hypothetical protein
VVQTLEPKGERVKISFKEIRVSWFVVFCLAAILAILACNTWLLCCGHCVLSDFLRIPTIGWAIILANLAAGVVLFAVKRRSDKKTERCFCCACQTSLRDSWVYCPICGSEHLLR